MVVMIRCRLVAIRALGLPEAHVAEDVELTDFDVGRCQTTDVLQTGGREYGETSGPSTSTLIKLIWLQRDGPHRR